MAKTTATSNGSDARAALVALTQTDAAWLIGKPASWLRERGHLFARRDGLYDARQILVALQGEFQAATLGNETLEPILHFAEDVADFAVTTYAPAIELLESVERKYGAAGLAAVAQTIIDVMRERSPQSYVSEPSADEITDRADREIERLTSRVAHSQYRRLFVCRSCKSYRWGAEWRPAPIPKGYAIVGEILCPECERKPRRNGRGRQA